MTRPLALDLFCKAGGASMGLYHAGFDVVGVDIELQRQYPFEFVQGDALDPPFNLRAFDFIWASPVCKLFTVAGAYQRNHLGTVYPNQIPATRELLTSSGAFWVIENVPQAPIRPDVILDGTMFPDLKVIRRRHFETNFPVPLRLGFDASGYVSHKGWCSIAGEGRQSGLPVKANAWHTVAAKRLAMGIDWMTGSEISQAVPPAYAEFIGRAAIEALGKEQAV